MGLHGKLKIRWRLLSPSRYRSHSGILIESAVYFHQPKLFIIFFHGCGITATSNLDQDYPSEALFSFKIELYNCVAEEQPLKVYTKKDYLDAVNEFVKLIDRKYGEMVEAVYVGGSVARGDFVPGRSDIDFYVVSKASNKEELQKKLNEEAKKLEAKYFKDLRYLHDEVIGATVTTLEELCKGCSFLGTGFEYQNFIKTGKLL
jgi:predicted nucleotidyltransferase